MSLKLDFVSGGTPKIMDGFPAELFAPEYSKFLLRITEKELPLLGARLVFRFEDKLFVQATENEKRQFSEANHALDKLKADYQELEKLSKKLNERKIVLTEQKAVLTEQKAVLTDAKAHFDKAAELARQSEELRISSANKIQSGTAKIAAADNQIAELKAKKLEESRLAMVGALTRMVYAHYDSKNPANRQADIASARKYVEAFSDKIVSSYTNNLWTVVMVSNTVKCTRLSKEAFQTLVKHVITDSRFPGLASPELDMGGFKDEIDIQGAIEFVLSTPHLKSITFGDLSSEQLSMLVKGLSGHAKIREPNFIKFTNDSMAVKFTEELKRVPTVKTNGSQNGSLKVQIKALPAVPPGKNPVLNTSPVAIAPVGSNTPQPLVPNRGSPPKSQA